MDIINIMQESVVIDEMLAYLYYLMIGRKKAAKVFDIDQLINNDYAYPDNIFPPWYKLRKYILDQKALRKTIAHPKTHTYIPKTDQAKELHNIFTNQRNSFIPEWIPKKQAYSDSL